MKCGDLGFVGKDGRPCGQNIPARATACIWHGQDEEGRRKLAMKGSLASRMRTIACLPPDTRPPALDSPAAVRTEIASTINDVRTGKLDHRLGQVVIAGIGAALKLAELEIAAQIGDIERRLRLRA